MKVAEQKDNIDITSKRDSNVYLLKNIGRQKEIFEDHKKKSNSNRKVVRVSQLKLNHLNNQKINKPLSFKEIENKNLSDLYSNEILENFNKLSIKSRENCLTRHALTVVNRCKMLDWMIEVLHAYNHSEATFFLSVKIMDFYFTKTLRKYDIRSLHLIGVTSIFIACKYEEIYPTRLQTFYEKIVHRKISIDQIREKEADILAVLDYNLNFVSNYEIGSLFLNFLLQNEQIQETQLSYLDKTFVYFSKLSEFQFNLNIKNNISETAAACLYLTFKIMETIDSNFSTDVYTSLIVRYFQINMDNVQNIAFELIEFAKAYPIIKFNGFEINQSDCSENLIQFIKNR